MGAEIDLVGIPGVVVNNHNEAPPYWAAADLSDASMFRIDTHDDMQHGAKFVESLPDDLIGLQKYFDSLNIQNFNVAAVNYRIISEILDYNPQYNTLTDRGTALPVPGRLNLNTVVEDGRIWWEDTTRGEGERLIRQALLKFPHTTRQKLLDIDLDGFCCHVTDGHTDGVRWWRSRVRKTVKHAAEFGKPDYISLTRSQGELIDGRRFDCYVPPDLVDKVQAYAIEKLTELYSDPRFN